jgi:hypothetical protein
MACALLVAREDKIKVRRIVDGVKDGQNSASGVSKYMLDVVSEHHFVEYLTAAEADKSVVQ